MHKQSNGRKTVAIRFITMFVFASIASLLLLPSHAATPVTAIEAESGTIGSPASIVSDTSAANNKAVKFTAAGGTSSTCPVYPSFPNASCTGVPAGITLTPSGSITVNTNGTTIQNLDITGTLTINATNVTVKNCKVHSNSGGGPGINVQGSATIRNTEIYGFDDEAIGWSNWSGYNLNIHDVLGDGVKFGSNVILQDSYLHDFTPGPGAHADGGQLQDGESNITIAHNTITPGSNSVNAALFFAPDLGPNGSGPIAITNNLLGGGGYTLFIVDGNNGQYHQAGYTVTGNHFLRDSAYGPVRVNEPASSFVAWSGNVYDDNGATIAKP